MKVIVTKQGVVLVTHLLSTGPPGRSCEGLLNRGLPALSRGLLKSEGRCTEHESAGPVVVTV